METPDNVQEPVEIKETLVSLLMLLKALINNVQKPTTQYMTWFILRVQSVQELCVNKVTMEKLQRAVKLLGKAKGKIQQEEIKADFYSLAQNAWGIMNDVFNSLA